MRKSAKWLLLAAVLAGVVYRVQFAGVPVQVFEVKPGEVIGEVMGTGTLEARVKTTISARIQERLAEVLVDQGDGVRSGQLLARLDDAETKQQVAIAEATLDAARATVERVKSDEARAQAVLQQAQLAHRRSTELLAGKIAAQADFDKTAEALHVAEADLSRAHSAIVEAERQVLAAEKTLLYHKEHLAFTEMRSPYDGLITRRDRDPGGVVVPGASVLQLVATNEIWVSAWVDETAMAGVAPGQPARVIFRSIPGRSYPAEVARLGRETDRETREFLVDVRIKELPANWTIGQRAEVFIQTGRRADALSVPQHCVQWRDGKAGLFVAQRGKAMWREVTLGLHGRERVEVTGGLTEQDQVVAPSDATQPPLKPGRHIAAR